ncbi:MAG: type II toxin-antitoxin system VapC family toxin [Gemmatimonadaceae bacterium]
MIVADCTLITQLFLRTEHARAAERLSAVAWIVPPLWRSELRNVCRKYILAGLVSLVEAQAAMRLAEERLEATERRPSSDRVLATVATTRCSAYDAEYVVLALTFGVPLVTSDVKLQRLFPEFAISPATAVATRSEG